MSRHQEQLSLRISQEVIDHTVNSLPLRCTHFDAWRFFHPDAQNLNKVTPMSRSTQKQIEQPGCVHANMDLFRWAYEINPLVSSELLVASLRLAVHARQIDMRASPYDVSAFEGCEQAIMVETTEGRKQYAMEQEELFAEAQPIRRRLLDIYDEVLVFILTVTYKPDRDNET